MDTAQALAHLTALGYQAGDTVHLRRLPLKNGGVCLSMPVNRVNSLKQPPGEGMYFVVNPGGHRDADIKECRCIFAEWDTRPIEWQKTAWKEFGLPAPTLQVSTGNKSVHNYWRLAEPIAPDLWKELQTDLLTWLEADPALKNPSRIMRLAGSVHQKTGEQARIIHQSDAVYSYAELRAIIPGNPAKTAPPLSPNKPVMSTPQIAGDDALYGCLAKEHRALIDSGVGKGGRNQTAYRLATDLIGVAHWLEVQGIHADPRRLFDQFCDRCSPPLDDRERDAVWRSASQSNPTPCLSADKLETCLQAIRGGAGTESVGKTSKLNKPLFETDTYQSRLEQIAAASEGNREPMIAVLSKETGIPFGAVEKRVAQMVTKAQSPPVEAQDLTDFLGGENEPLRWLVEGILPAGETLILGAEPKVGKTLLAVDLAYAVAAGEPFLGLPVARGGVLVVSTDESPQSTRSKLFRRGFRPGMPVAVLTQFDVENLEPLVAAIEKFRPSLVVVDSLKSITKNLTVSENSPEFANFVYRLKEVFSAYGCAAVLIHHISKNREHAGVNKLRGSTAIAGAAWGVWLLDRTGENSVTLECISRDIPGESIAISLHPESMRWERIGTPPPQEGTLTDKIIHLLRTRTNSATGLEAVEIKEALGIDNKYIYSVLNRLCEKRIIGKRESKLKSGRMVYYLAQSPLVNRVSTTKQSDHSLKVPIHGHLKVMTTPPDSESSQSPPPVTPPDSESLSSQGGSHHAESPYPSDFEPPMMTNLHTPPIEGCQQKSTIDSEGIDGGSGRNDKSSTHDCEVLHGYIPRLGDSVKYIGANGSLRVQCGHSRRDGLRVTAVDKIAQTACFKAPKWLASYSVPWGDLKPDRSTRHPPKPWRVDEVALGGSDDP